MVGKIKSGEREYWGQAFIAIAQIAFGIFWASFFVPTAIDNYRVFVIIFNLVASVVFLALGWIFIRKHS